MIQPTLIDVHPNECSQELHYHPFDVKLDVLEVVILLIEQNRRLNLRMFNMITRIKWGHDLMQNAELTK